MRMKKKEYVYFISYAHANGFGNAPIVPISASNSNRFYFSCVRLAISLA